MNVGKLLTIKTITNIYTKHFLLISFLYMLLTENNKSFIFLLSYKLKYIKSNYTIILRNLYNIKLEYNKKH